LSQTFLSGKHGSSRTLPSCSFMECLISIILLSFVVTNTARAVQGSVVINYDIGIPIFGGQGYGLGHYASDAKEGLDNHDNIYGEMYNPSAL